MTNKLILLARRSVVLPVLFGLVAAFAACESEPTRPIRNVAVQTKPSEPSEPAEPRPPRKPLATVLTEWAGVEARLLDCSRRGPTLLVEIELANTGTAPASIENYSARTAVMSDDATKATYEVFAAGAGPVATDGLSQVLAPGETTTVTASFPLSSKARLVSMIFPKMGKFEAIPIR